MLLMHASNCFQENSVPTITKMNETKKKHYMKTKYVNIRISNRERDGARNKGRQVQPRPNCPTEPSPDQPRSRGEGKEEEDEEGKGKRPNRGLERGEKCWGQPNPPIRNPSQALLQADPTEPSSLSSTELSLFLTITKPQKISQLIFFAGIIKTFHLDFF